MAMTSPMSMQQIAVSMAMIFVAVLSKKFELSIVEGVMMGILSLFVVLSMMSLSWMSQMMSHVETMSQMMSHVETMSHTLGKMSTRLTFVEKRMMYHGFLLHEQCRVVRNHFLDFDETLSGIEWVAAKVSNELMIMRTLCWRSGVDLMDEWDRMVMRCEKGPEMSMKSRN